MKRFSALALALCVGFVATLLGGCANQQLATFDQTVKAGTDQILPEYETYVTNDPALSASDKAIKVNTSENLKSVVAKYQTGTAATTQPAVTAPNVVVPAPAPTPVSPATPPAPAD